MKIRDGVEIILHLGSRIPLWIRVQDVNVEVKRLRLEDKRQYRLLRIKGGEATFAGEGRGYVRVPGSTNWITCFKPREVLRITTLEHGKRTEKDNFHLCTKCFALTGFLEVRTDNPPGHLGKSRLDFVCADCGHGWNRLY